MSKLMFTPPLRLAVAATLAILAPGTASAHDYWLERSGDGYALLQGHAYSSHQGESRVPYDPAIVKRVTCAPGQGDARAVEPQRAYPVRAAGPCAAVLFEVSSGYWSQTLSETVQKPKTEVRGALRGWRSEEAVKRIDAWTPGTAKPLSEGWS